MRKFATFFLAQLCCLTILSIQGGATAFAQQLGTPGDLPDAPLVGDRVWHDLDQDGVQDEDEPGIADITIQLFQDETLVAESVTDGAGAYLFSSLTAGAYAIQVVLPVTYTDYMYSPALTTTTTADLDNNADMFGRIDNIVLTDETVDLDYDIGLILHRGVIGNYVWLDENGDGVQDVGESGMGNIVLELLDVQGELITTTRSDAEGGYIFNRLTAGVYTVRIERDSLPDGATWSSVIHDSDVGSQNPDGVTFTLESGQEQMGADFGIVFGNPIGNDGFGAIGGRIWSDNDENGRADAGEAGIGNVLVSIKDGNNVLVGTTRTEPTGFYIFSNLGLDGYTISVNTQPGSSIADAMATFDPDFINLPNTDADDKTTSPIVLPPGDAYLNANFGYKLTVAPDMSGTIQARVYLDTNANGEYDPSRPDGSTLVPAVPSDQVGTDRPTLILQPEPGFAGVTVSLSEANLEGDQSEEDVIATTTTNEEGLVEFSGIPDGNYRIKVSDTNNILGEVAISGDPDAILDGEALFALAQVQLEDAEFGYAPEGHQEDAGLFGDHVFFDGNDNGRFDTGEGIQGIIIQLFDDKGNMLPSTRTSETGRYFFGNVTENGTYRIKIVESSVPEGMVNTIDPDNNTPLEAEIVFDNTILLNLGGADFGFTAVSNMTDTQDTLLHEEIGRISGNIWNDEDADGTLDETLFFADVSVNLYIDANRDGVLNQSEGDTLIATTLTDRDGAFRFEHLPIDDISYIIGLEDPYDVLASYWSTNGVQPGANNQSQQEPYAVMLTPENPVNDTADFGYFTGNGAIGNRIWIDMNENGIQDEGDIDGLEHSIIFLESRHENGQVHRELERDVNGHYAFYNLDIDENSNVLYKLFVQYNIGPNGDPITTTSDTSNLDQLIYEPTLTDQTSNEQLDSDNPEGEFVTPIRGQFQVATLADPALESPEASYDFGFVLPDATAVTLQEEAVNATNVLLTVYAIFGLLGVISLSVWRSNDS